MTAETTEREPTTAELDDAAKEIAELEAELPADFKPDLVLPSDYELDIMAQEHLSWLTTYHKATQAGRAARHAGKQHQVTAEASYKQAQLARIAVALIQHDYPGVKVLSDEIAGLQARRAKGERARAQEQKE